MPSGKLLTLFNVSCYTAMWNSVPEFRLHYHCYSESELLANRNSRLPNFRQPPLGLRGRAMRFNNLTWIFVCISIGLCLNWIIEPTGNLSTAILFVFPFVVLGFQERPEKPKSSRNVIGMRLYGSNHSFRLTFWGIPIQRANMNVRYNPVVNFLSDSVHYSKAQQFTPVILRKLLHS